MAKYIHLAKSYDGFNPGGPVGIRCDMPMDWTAHPSPTVSWSQPWLVPFALGHAMHHKVKDLSAQLNVTYPGYAWSYTVPLTRKFQSLAPVVNEYDLHYPEILEADTYASPADSPTLYTGTVNDDGWDGPGSLLFATVTVQLFKKYRITIDAVTYDVPHFTWQNDGLIILPSVHVSGELGVQTSGGGLEVNFPFTSEPQTFGVTQTETASVLAANGGGDVDLVFPGSATFSTFSLEITRSGVWAWV